LEDTGAYEFMQKKFHRLGLTVPEIFAVDHESGFVLMEDFGDERFFELVTHRKTDLNTLYKLAVDVLVHKYKADPAVALDQSVAYSDDYWMFRIEQFLQYYMPHAFGRAATDGERQDFLALFRQAVTGAHEFSPVLLHGDFVVQNLYHLPKRSGLKALGIIDFQDMTDARGNMMGSPAFDLAFLLQDVRVDLPPELETQMKARFIDQAKISDVYNFDMEYAVIGMSQAVKCLGLFSRFGHVNGRKEYLDFLPFCWRNVKRNSQHPAMAGIIEWFQKTKTMPE
jgi:aminoglycoside/choline kinase family phosphotransferase